MALLGKLAVAVVGDINQLRQSFKEVKAEAKSLDKEIHRTGYGIAQIAKTATIAGTAIVGAMGAMVLSTARAAEQIDLLAKRTGISREELQGLAYAAQQEGTNIEALGTALARLSRNMYDASQGTGEAKEAFRDFGINVTTADGQLRSAADVLMDLADRMANMTSETEMQALAMKTLGRSGAELVPFLRMGSEEIKRLMREAKELGYIIDEETNKRFEQFMDTLFSIRIGLAGFGRQIASDVLPYFQSFAQGIKETLKFLHQFLEPIRKIISQGSLAAGVFALLSGSITTFLVKITASKAALAAFGASLGKLTLAGGIAGAVIVALGLIVQKLAEVKHNAELAKEEIGKIYDVAKAEEILSYWEGEVKRLKELAENYAKMNAAQRKFMEWFYDISSLNQIWRQLDNAQKKAKEAREQLDKLLAKEKTKTGTEEVEKWDYNKYVQQVKESLQKIDIEVKQFGDVTDAASKKANILRDAIIELALHGYGDSQQIKQWIKDYEKYANEAKNVADALKLEEESHNLLNQAREAENEWLNRNKSNYEKLADTLEAMAKIDTEHSTELLIAASRMRQLAYEQKIVEDVTAREAESKMLLSQAMAQVDQWRNRELSSLEVLARQLEAQALLDEKNAKALREWAEELRKLDRAQTEVSAKDLLAQGQEYLAEMTGKAQEEWQKFAKTLRETAGKEGVLPETAEQLIKLADAIEEAGAKKPITDKIAEAQKYLADMTQKALPDWEKYARSLEELANSGVASDLAQQLFDLAAAIRKAGQEASETTWREALADMAEEALDWNKRMVDVATQTAKAINGAFEDFFFDAFTGQLKTAEDYWRAFTQSIARMLAQLLSQQLVYAFIRNLFPGLNFGVPAMAAGGSVAAGTAYLVGERGPELFVPATSGTIVPNDQMAVGANVSVNLINQSGMPLKARQQGEPFFDGRRAVVSLILEADDRNIGGLHDRLRRR